MYLNFGYDEVDLLKNYANETAKNMGARRNKPIVTGWCSWYQFFSQVHEKDILQTVKYLKELKQKNEIIIHILTQKTSYRLDLYPKEGKNK